MGYKKGNNLLRYIILVLMIGFKVLGNI